MWFLDSGDLKTCKSTKISISKILLHQKILSLPHMGKRKWEKLISETTTTNDYFYAWDIANAWSTKLQTLHIFRCSKISTSCIFIYFSSIFIKINLHNNFFFFPQKSYYIRKYFASSIKFMALRILCILALSNCTLLLFCCTCAYLFVLDGSCYFFLPETIVANFLHLMVLIC